MLTGFASESVSAHSPDERLQGFIACQSPDLETRANADKSPPGAIAVIMEQ